MKEKLQLNLLKILYILFYVIAKNFLENIFINLIYTIQDSLDSQALKIMTTQYQRVSHIYKRMIQIFKSHPDRQKNMLIQLKPPRMNIKFNRPKRYNAFTIDMYDTLTESIKNAAEMKDIKFIVLSGEGGNYSSGNDLTNFTNPKILELGDFGDVIKASSLVLKNLTDAVISSKKPIIAITQGKVIGVSFTELALFDKVFAVENSVFTAPLVSSAQGPEMCASYTFPKIFGKTIAEQLVTFGKTVNASFLQKFNFVQKCKDRKQAEQKLQQYLDRIDQLEWQSYINARRLYKQVDQNLLLQICSKQIDNLVERWQNPQLLTNIAKHMERMKKKQSAGKL